METLTTADALARLKEPFASKDVKWLVAATSRDGRKGRVTPYADPRAYTDRLNHIFTASGWTRHYEVHTVSPITRMKGDKPIQTGKVFVTCVLTIPSVGTHSGCGEEWAEDPNALTSAEAQAFKRACSNFGLGRYFYSFAEMWVDKEAIASLTPKIFKVSRIEYCRGKARDPLGRSELLTQGGEVGEFARSRKPG
jgi:hypothetical protein